MKNLDKFLKSEIAYTTNTKEQIMALISSLKNKNVKVKNITSWNDRLNSYNPSNIYLIFQENNILWSYISDYNQSDGYELIPLEYTPKDLISTNSIVKIRNSRLFFVAECNNYLKLVNLDNCDSLNLTYSYENDLTTSEKEYDIVAIQNFYSQYNAIMNLRNKYFHYIWDWTEPKKQMTIEQIEEILGYSIEIVTPDKQEQGEKNETY